MYATIIYLFTNEVANGLLVQLNPPLLLKQLFIDQILLDSFHLEFE
jgi:hypothetical protein